MTRRDMVPLDRAARDAGRLQCRLRLLADTLPAEPPGLRDAVARAADKLDEADELLTRAYCDWAPQPRGRAA